MKKKAAEHREAALMHEAAAERHASAAQLWDEIGDLRRVDLEELAAKTERELAEIERQRARVDKKDPVRRK